MRSLRIAALLSFPLAIAAAIVVLALPRQMDRISQGWAERSSIGRASTVASLVAADLDFDDRIHADSSLALLAAQGDVLAAVVRRADGSTFASWTAATPAGPRSRVVTVPIDGPGGAAGSLSVRFSTAAMHAQSARNRRLGWTLALGLLALGVVVSVGLTLQVRRATRIEVARELEAGFHALVEDLPDGIVIHRGGVVTYVNARGRALLALEAGAAGAELATLSEPPLHQLGDRGGAVDVRTRFGPLRLEVERRPAHFGGATQELIVLRDVGDRERMRQRLELTQRMASVGSLAAGVAHEINNPLTVILANLEMLASQTAEPAETPELLAEATDATLRVRRIVDDMRRLTRGDQQDAPAPFAIRPALQRAVSLTAAEVRHRARVEIDDGRGDHTAIGSESRLVQVLVNVLVNAAHATPPGDAGHHRVQLAVRADGNTVEISVTDDGAGMPPEVLARVFDPFFTTKDVGVGTGLGLAICHSLMQAMGGSIAITSEVGVGTTVSLRLPAAAAGDAPRVAAPRQRPAPSRFPAVGPRVLVIDDEPTIRASVEKMLGACAVTTAPSGPAALETVSRGARFDLIVCDVLMPEMTGPAVRARLAQSAPDQARRMVFMTGGVDHRATDVGDAGDVLRKPFSRHELEQFVITSIARLAA
jgi:signal transduction histidine kinase/CheY-like chemotaxis protein